MSNGTQRYYGVIFPIDSFFMIVAVSIVGLLGYGIFAAAKWLLTNFVAILLGFWSLCFFGFVIAKAINYFQDKKAIIATQPEEKQEGMVAAIRQDAFKSIGKMTLFMLGGAIALVAAISLVKFIFM